MHIYGEWLFEKVLDIHVLLLRYNYGQRYLLQIYGKRKSF